MDRLRKFLCLIVLIPLVFVGCASTGGPNAQGPIEPIEVKTLATMAISVAINVEDMGLKELDAIERGLLMAKTAILTALANDPGSVPAFDVGTIDGLDPLYQDLISDVLQIALRRIRPYIDGENPDLLLAREYIEATIDGGLAGINRARTRLALNST